MSAFIARSKNKFKNVTKRILDDKKEQIKKFIADDVCTLEKEKNIKNFIKEQAEIYNLKKQIESLNDKFATEILRNKKLTKELDEMKEFQ